VWRGRCGRAKGDQVAFVSKTALSLLGRRVLALDAEKEQLDSLMAKLVEKTAPELLGLYGVGVDTAAALLVAAGDNPGRIRSEAAWPQLCGVAPIPASSGKVTRWRLDRGGDRQANAALYVIVLARMSADKATTAYVQRRVAEGRTKLEIVSGGGVATWSPRSSRRRSSYFWRQPPSSRGIGSGHSRRLGRKRWQGARRSHGGGLPPLWVRRSCRVPRQRHGPSLT
jgi:hypothetical protein